MNFNSLKICSNLSKFSSTQLFLKFTLLEPNINQFIKILDCGSHRSYETLLLKNKFKGKKREFDDELQRADVETSKKYMESEAYKTTYGDEPVWTRYRRNFKGQYPPRLTRISCIIDGMFVTGNPCPICRDRYLVPHYENPKLLKQFVSPHTDQILPFSKTQICQAQHYKVTTEIEKARLYGYLPFYVHHRDYDYQDYYNFENKS